MKYLLFTIISFFTFQLSAQDVNDQELHSFWDACITPMIEKDKNKIEEIVHFPLQGEWGFAMELTQEEWTKELFFANYEKLITEEVITNLKKQTHKNVKVQNLENGQNELIVTVHLEVIQDDEKYESSIFFRFKKIDNQWSLYWIQLAG